MKNAPDALYQCTAKLFILTALIPYFISSKSVMIQHLSFDNLYAELNVKLI